MAWSHRNGIALASIGAVNGIAIASIGAINGIDKQAGGGTPFDLTFGRNTTDDYSMDHRNGVQGSPTFTGAVEPTGFLAQSNGDFAAIRPNLAAAGLGTVTLTTAELVIYCEAVYGGASTWTVYRSLRAWVAGQMSYNNYSTGNAWGTAGATNATDRSASSVGSNTNAAATAITISLNLSAMEDLVNNGGTGDQSLLIFGSGFCDATGGGGSDGNRPYLRLAGTYV
jgi:hypothetical protein